MRRMRLGWVVGILLMGEALSGFAAPKAVPVMALPAPSGPKKAIAVGTFENKAGGWANWDLGTGMAEMMTTALIRSNAFIVLERPEIEKVITEQDFGVSGRTAGG